MRIGQFAKKFGIDTRTIDFYTKTPGLLEPKAIPGSNYRDYDEECEKTLLKILIFRDVGLSINEIQEALKDPSYFTREKLDKHIAEMEEHRDREMKRYDDMIDFAKTMRDTSMVPLRMLQLFDDSALALRFIKAFTEGVNLWRNGGELYDFDDENELADLFIALLSNLKRNKTYGYASNEVQKTLDKAFSRLDKYIPTILALSLSFISESENDLLGIEEEFEEGESDFLKSVFRLSADWYRFAKTPERILDFELFKEEFAERVRELDALYRKIDEDYDSSVIDDTFEIVCNTYQSMQNSASKILGAQLLMGFTAGENLDGEYGEGFTQFIDDALKKYVNDNNDTFVTE